MGVPSEVQAGTGGTDEVLGGCRLVLRVGEMERGYRALIVGGWDVVHIQRREGNCICLLVRCPSGGRLDGV